MPRFEPFRAVRYDFAAVDPARVTVPPYDVIDADQRAALASADPHAAVHIDLPVGGEDRYEKAAALLAAWEAAGVLVREERPSFSVYRMTHRDPTGQERTTTGVIGALELSRPGEGDILPHEETTPKAKTDRLELLRATRANLSPIWGLSPAAGLTALCEQAEDLLADWHDGEGVRHQLWRVEDPGLLDELAATVSAEPVVIADGHHRYETSLAYRDERRHTGGAGGGWDLTLAFVVELAEEQLTVEPIHRLVEGLPAGLGVAEALSGWFDVLPAEGFEAGSVPALVDGGVLGLVTPDATYLLRPTEALEAAAGRDLDSVRVDAALEALPGARLRFQHGVGNVVAAVGRGEADAGILVRPATVDQIIEIARGGRRMPPKTTFFHPKPRTGTVFRPLD